MLGVLCTSAISEVAYNEIIIIILDSYIAQVSTLQGPQGAPTLPGYARLPISTLTAFKGIPSYRYSFNTWVESGKCRSMSCQRTLAPRLDFFRIYS